MTNANGGVNGRRVTLVDEDNAYHPQRTVAAARKLVARDELAIGMPSGILPPISCSPERHLGVTRVRRAVAKGGKCVAVGTPVEAGRNW